MATQTYKGKKHTNLADCDRERRRAWCRYFDMKRENEALLEVMAEVGKYMGKVLYANKWDKGLQRVFKPIHKAHPKFNYDVCPVCRGPMDVEPKPGYKQTRGRTFANWDKHAWCCPESDALDSSDDEAGTHSVGAELDEENEVEEKE